MIKAQHPSNNRVLGAPRGWNQSGSLECGALAITDSMIGDQPCIISYFKPDERELKLLNEGAFVMLTIVGRGMPPVCLDVSK